MIFEMPPTVSMAHLAKVDLQNPDIVNHIREKLKKQRFMHHLHMDLTKIEKGYIESELDPKEFHLQQIDFVHGGVLATICDVTAGFAAYSLVKTDEVVVTADLRVSYLNPALGGRLISRGWVVKPGSKLFFCESDVWSNTDDGWIMVCKSSSTMALVKLDEVKKKQEDQ